MRDDRQAEAGSSQVGSPASRDSSRISSFVEPDLVERAAHAELTRRLTAGPVVAAIVGVAAVGDDGNAALAADRDQVRVELVLAEVAAIGRIGAILGPLSLVGRDDLVLQPEVARRSAAPAGDAAPGSWGCWR